MSKTKKDPTPAKYGIYIAAPDAKTARKLERAVMKVLNSAAGDDVKKAALTVMAGALSTTASISNCNITT